MKTKHAEFFQSFKDRAAAIFGNNTEKYFHVCEVAAFCEAQLSSPYTESYEIDFLKTKFKKWFNKYIKED